MQKDSFNSFIKSKTTHRIPKLATLAITATVLVAMVNIDASASGYGGRNSLAIRDQAVLTLASDSSNSQFSGLIKRWEPITPAEPTTTTSTSVATTSVAPVVSGGGGAGSSGGGGSSSGGGGSSGGTGGGTTTTTTTPQSTTTTTTPPTTTTTTTSAPSTQYPIGTPDSSEPSGYAPPSANAMPGYTQSYVTDFTGSSLPANWGSYGGAIEGDPGAYYSQAHVTVGNGMLQFNTWQDPNYGNNWVTGGACLCGLPGQVTGAYFVRSRLTGAGATEVELLVPDANVWPPELDFNESFGGTNMTSATVHYSPSDLTVYETLSNVDLTQWHTWGLIWTPTELIYTIDGTVWGTVNNPAAIPTIPMHISLQQQTWCASNWACPTNPTSLDVDWVAEYSANS